MLEFNPFSEEFFNDPNETYRRLRDEAPVYHNERFGFWALSRYDDVVAAHRDWETFSSEFGVEVDALLRHQRDPSSISILTMDPPVHDRLRRLVSRAFTPRAMAGMEPLVREVQAKFLEPLMARDEFDIVAEFLALFPCEVISRILGVPESDRELVRRWTDEMLHREVDDPNTTEAGLAAIEAQDVYFTELAHAKRAKPDEHMISQLCQAEVEDPDGTVHQLSDEDIGSFVNLIAGAGTETVTKLVGSAVVEFWRHPEQWRLVVDGAANLVDTVEEVLRYHPPAQYQGRYALREATFEGGTIPANQPVLLLTGAAMRDPRAIDDPDRFDVTRTPQLSVSLGHGIHSCLGAALARLEGRVALDEIRQRWPRYEVDEGGLRRVHMANVAGYSNVPITLNA